MDALIIAGAAGLVLLGIHQRDGLMICVGLIALLIPTVMLITSRRANNQHAKQKADLIARFATEQQEQKESQHE